MQCSGLDPLSKTNRIKCNALRAISPCRRERCLSASWVWADSSDPAQLELRLQEEARLGFQRAVVPRCSGLGALAAGLDLARLEADGVTEVLVLALGEDVTDQK